MRRKPFLKRLAAVVLFFVLVAGEALAVVHSLDFDAHASGDACSMCISVASLGTGAPPKVSVLDLAPPGVPVASPCTHAIAMARKEPPTARGPPLVS